MTVLVVMGVAGCGKSTVARLLSERLGWPFMEGDSLHPGSNVTMMAAGHPLSDEDRWPWLEEVAEWIESRRRAREHGVITCSALKRSYRDLIRRGRDDVVLVHLVGERHTLEQRLGARAGHYMPATMLESQLEALEEPQPDECAVRVPIEQPPGRIADQVLTALGLGD